MKYKIRVTLATTAIGTVNLGLTSVVIEGVTYTLSTVIAMFDEWEVAYYASGTNTILDLVFKCGFTIQSVANGSNGATSTDLTTIDSSGQIIYTNFQTSSVNQFTKGTLYLIPQTALDSVPLILTIKGKMIMSTPAAGGALGTAGTLNLRATNAVYLALKTSQVQGATSISVITCDINKNAILTQMQNSVKGEEERGSLFVDAFISKQ